MYILFSGITAGLAQLVECLSAEQGVAGFDSQGQTNTPSLKITEN